MSNFIDVADSTGAYRRKHTKPAEGMYEPIQNEHSPETKYGSHYKNVPKTTGVTGLRSAGPSIFKSTPKMKIGGSSIN